MKTLAILGIVYAIVGIVMVFIGDRHWSVLPPRVRCPEPPGCKCDDCRCPHGDNYDDCPDCRH